MSSVLLLCKHLANSQFLFLHFGYVLFRLFHICPSTGERISHCRDTDVKLSAGDMVFVCALDNRMNKCELLEIC